MIGLRKHTGVVDDLIWYILKLLMKIVNANDCQVIVNANVNLATLSVSEAGHPLQVFVFPYAFMLNILILVVHISSIEKEYKTILLFPLVVQIYHKILILTS